MERGFLPQPSGVLQCSLALDVTAPLRWNRGLTQAIISTVYARHLRLINGSPSSRDPLKKKIVI